MDARLKDEYPSRGAFQVALLAQSCLAYDPKVRPSMEEVLEVLKKFGVSIKGVRDLRKGVTRKAIA
ncbi:hypothetical protein RJ640_029596 [Escallonia rubra]|uniref:Uncharacterized protein n=1 Tax=Escallonia rubra TaxID=112253 RepID=A0AA88RTQ1_9ASTE|nr:hypothetical protein RJ640_029596 [Escallonia rubra]